MFSRAIFLLVGAILALQVGHIVPKEVCTNNGCNPTTGVTFSFLGYGVGVMLIGVILTVYGYTRNRPG